MILENDATADGENDKSRISTDDRRQWLAFRRNQIANGIGLSPDFTFDRCANVGVAEIEFRFLQRCFRLQHLGGAHLLRGYGLIELLLADRTRLDGHLIAGERRLRLRQGSLGLCDIGLGAADGGFIRRLLDDEHQVALGDLLTLFEQTLLEESRYTRPEIDTIRCHNATDQTERRRHVLANHRCHGHRWRRRGRRLLLLLITSDQQ